MSTLILDFKKGTGWFLVAVCLDWSFSKDEKGIFSERESHSSVYLGTTQINVKHFTAAQAEAVQWQFATDTVFQKNLSY